MEPSTSTSETPASNKSNGLPRHGNDTLSEAFEGLFLNIANVSRLELQGSSNQLELIKKMNLATSKEYENFADFASGLLVFVERLKQKNESLCAYLEQIEKIDKEVIELEAVVSTLDGYTGTLEAKGQPQIGRQSKIQPIMTTQSIGPFSTCWLHCLSVKAMVT